MMRSRSLSLVLSALLALGTLPSFAAKDSAPKGARLVGIVRGADGKPAGNVKVVLAPLQSRGTSVSTLTKSDGTYGFEKLSHGLYEVGFETSQGAFASNRVLLISPAKKLDANFDLGPFQPQDKSAGLEPGQPVPGLNNAPAVGVAHLQEASGPQGLKWLRTGKGVATLIGVSTLLIGGIIAYSEHHGTSTSPSTVTP